MNISPFPNFLPCPFCGSFVDIKCSSQHEGGDIRSCFYIKCCVSMGEFGPWGYQRTTDPESDSEALKKLARNWNTRK